MSEKQNEIEVYQSARFEKVLKKMSDNDLKVVEDEIDRIIDNPLIGELKKVTLIICVFTNLGSMNWWCY